MKTIIINSTNSVAFGEDRSRFTYNFPISATFQDQQVAVSSLSIYYSWFNISSTLGNTTISYYWPVGAGTTVNITIPNGFYNASTLNAYFQSVMITNNHYLINPTGDYVYYWEIVENASAYAIQFNSYPIPTALPAGWSAPPGWGGYPAVASTPQLIVPATNIRNVIGFNSGTYPTVVQATNYSKISDFVPQFSPVQSVLISCSLVQNPLAVPSNIIYSFAPTNTNFGSLISPAFSNFIWNDITNGTFPSFTIQFLDQNFTALPLRDVNLVMVLSIRDKIKNGE